MGVKVGYRDKIIVGIYFKGIINVIIYYSVCWGVDLGSGSEFCKGFDVEVNMPKLE